MTKVFAEQHKQEQYTIQEMIELTEGQYNSNVFKEFFGSRI